MKKAYFILLTTLIYSSTLVAQQMEISIDESEPYYASQSINLQIYLTNNTAFPITYFDSRGPSYNSFKEQWDLNVNDLRVELVPGNGAFDKLYSDTILKTLHPGEKSLIRNRTLYLEHRGQYSLTYMQQQSAEFIDKTWALPGISDSVWNQISTFKVIKNIKFDVHNHYDTIVTKLAQMTWEEWKEYRHVKVYSRDNFFDNIYMALKVPTNVYALTMNCSGFSREELTRLSRLKNLKSLNLINFELDTFPKELAELDLFELKIFPKTAQEIVFPYGISKNNTLRELTAKFYNRVPDSIVSLTNLIFLDISESNIAALPNLSPLKHLEELIANNNNLQTLQNLGFDSLPNLKSINLSGNKAIADISPLMKCTSLEFLTINRTAIPTIPHEIENLTKLKKLSVSSSLVSVSDSLGNLADLRYLSFGGNTKLDSIPKSINKLSKLLHIDLSRTNITQLPEGTAELPLEKVFIYNTPCNITKDYKDLKKRLGDDFKD